MYQLNLHETVVELFLRIICMNVARLLYNFVNLFFVQNLLLCLFFYKSCLCFAYTYVLCVHDLAL